MKRMFIVTLFFLVACMGHETKTGAVSRTTVTPTPSATPTPSFTPTVSPSPTFVPTATAMSERDQVLAQHEQERINYLAEQGAALSIPALEYHSDNYYIPFPNGAIVELSPAAFVTQMNWFHKNHVHAVTSEELISWLKGEIELPARSVILTFDLGNRPLISIYRMVEVFKKYQMFGIFTINTYGMDPSESISCKDDICWPAYRSAYASGYVSIGSHTITHSDCATQSADEGLSELYQSKVLIENKIGQGLVVKILTWPFESVPTWGDQISTIGFEAAFGGNTYPIQKNTVWRDKPEDFYRLPRILPPGSLGLSGRPNNKTLEEILKMYTNGWPK